MADARTVKTLTFLLAAMTVGAFLVMLMETAPIRPSAEPLAAYGTTDGRQTADVIRPRNFPLQHAKWQNIVVHTTGAEGRDVARRSHFIISPRNDGKRAIHATELWHNQMAGNHVYIPDRDFNADSIGICLQGDFAHQPPSATQFQALIDLVRDLQRTCAIEPANVYLHRDLDPRSPSPGRSFPARAFSRNLLTTTR